MGSFQSRQHSGAVPWAGRPGLVVGSQHVMRANPVREQLKGLLGAKSRAGRACASRE